MEILLWLVPPVAVTVVAMVWVGWLGREGRGEIDRDEAARRIGAALERERRGPDPIRAEPRQRSTGVVVRRTPAPLPAVQPAVESAPVEVLPGAKPVTLDPEQPVRRAS